MGRIYYRWTDRDGEEHITREPPGSMQSYMGGTYTPEYTRVVVTPVAEDE